MLAATNDSNARRGESPNTVEVLEELLGHSIRLRDLYKNARWQTADIQFRRLRQLFDAHYLEQVHLVDGLIERIRSLNSGAKIFAGDFLQPTHFSQSLRGRPSLTQLFAEIMDAHESVLDTATQGRTDFEVGLVVLTNNQQMLAVGEQWAAREQVRRVSPSWVD